MDIKRSGGIPPLGPDQTTGAVSGDFAAKVESAGGPQAAETTRRTARSSVETEDLTRLKSAVSGFTARDLNDAEKTKAAVEKVARELVETGTRSMPGLTGEQKADLAKFAESDPVMSNKILSFVREQVG